MHATWRLNAKHSLVLTTCQRAHGPSFWAVGLEQLKQLGWTSTLCCLKTAPQQSLASSLQNKVKQLLN